MESQDLHRTPSHHLTAVKPAIDWRGNQTYGALMSPARTAPSSGTRLAGIEGLRALAACSIVVYHSWLLASPTVPPSVVCSV
jgi:hypothetical protein